VCVPTACKTKEAAVYYQSRCHDPQLFFAVEVCAGGGRFLRVSCWTSESFKIFSVAWSWES